MYIADTDNDRIRILSKTVSEIGCLVIYSSDPNFISSNSLNLLLIVVISMAVVFVLLHMIVLIRTCKEYSFMYLVISSFASLDFGSDIFYLLFSNYRTNELAWASFAFSVCLPIVYFTYVVLIQHNLIPHFLYDWYIGRVISRRFKWNIFWIWLSSERGAPLVNNKRLSCTFNNHDSLVKVAVFITVWVALLAMQAVTLIPFFIWVIVLSPYYLPLIVIGSFLFHTKLLAHKDVWNMYVTLFTGRSSRYGKTSVYDTKLLNDALFTQLVFTSLPMLVIQSINETRGLGDITFGIFKVYAHIPISPIISGLYCAFFSYRYLYLVLRYKHSIQTMPFTLQRTIDNITKSVGLVETVEDIKHNKEAIPHYRRYWKARLAHAMLDDVMHDVVNLVTRVYFKDERMSDQLHILLKLRLDFVQSAFESADHKDTKFSLDFHRLASDVFKILMFDSTDLTMYRVLTEEGIGEANDLLNVKQNSINRILNALHNRSKHGTVMAYLNLITYNNNVSTQKSDVKENRTNESVPQNVPVSKYKIYPTSDV